jgi:hypothetical protein
VEFGEAILSAVLSLRFRLLAGGAQPKIEIRPTDTGRAWLV